MERTIARRDGDRELGITEADNEGMGGDTWKINFEAEIKMVKGKRGNQV